MVDSGIEWVEFIFYRVRELIYVKVNSIEKSYFKLGDRVGFRVRRINVILVCIVIVLLVLVIIFFWYWN